MTTISTGGFSTTDASFGAYQGPMEYAAVLFMMLASLPFVRYVQMLAGNGPAALARQPGAGLPATILVLVMFFAAYRLVSERRSA